MTSGLGTGAGKEKRESIDFSGDTIQTVLDLEAPDSQHFFQEVMAFIESKYDMPEAFRQEVAEALQDRADRGFRFGEEGVPILHHQIKAEGPSIQVLVRLARPLRLVSGQEEASRFVCLLLSPRRTHPHLDAAVEFSRLLQDKKFEKAALEAATPKALQTAYREALDREVHFQGHIPAELQPTSRLFQGLLDDVRRRLPHYKSDWVDGLSAKSLASTFFLFFACLAPAVAFGGLLSVLTKGEVGAIEMILATTVCGIVYSLFSAQPLTILGSTGPVIIFMGILYALCQQLGIPFMATYAWVGLWTMVFLLLLAIVGACSWIRFFTRFTDDTFAALIAIIFIVEAIKDLVHVFTDHQVSYATALLSLVLALGTYQISAALSRFRRSPYLRWRWREFFADFGPSIAILLMSGVAYLLNEVDLTTLAVPSALIPSSGRSWLVDPFAAPVWVWFAAAIPALLVSTLLYLDQNITVRLVNNPDHRLKKGAGYHLDLGLVGLLVGFCSLFGLPWMVAATVRSLNHVRSLATVEQRESGGSSIEVITSVVETRMTGFLVHLAVGLSLLFLTLLQQVPMSVLFGLFLFMGVTSMGGNQLFERLRLWIMDPQFFPPTSYLRAVPLSTIHKFTAIQLGCLIILWVVKASALGILFPLFIALLVPVRMSMDRFFKPAHLALLDSEETPKEEETRATD